MTNVEIKMEADKLFGLSYSNEVRRLFEIKTNPSLQNTIETTLTNEIYFTLLSVGIKENYYAELELSVKETEPKVLNVKYSQYNSKSKKLFKPRVKQLTLEKPFEQSKITIQICLAEPEHLEDNMNSNEKIFFVISIKH